MAKSQNRKTVAEMSEVEKSLLGAIEMLVKIKNGNTFNAVEYIERLQRYQQNLLKAQPQLENDPYFSAFMK